VASNGYICELSGLSAIPATNVAIQGRNADNNKDSQYCVASKTSSMWSRSVAGTLMLVSMLRSPWLRVSVFRGRTARARTSAGHLTVSSLLLSVAGQPDVLVEVEAAVLSQPTSSHGID